MYVIFIYLKKTVHFVPNRFFFFCIIHILIIELALDWPCDREKALYGALNKFFCSVIGSSNGKSIYSTVDLIDRVVKIRYYHIHLVAELERNKPSDNLVLLWLPFQPTNHI